MDFDRFENWSEITLTSIQMVQLCSLMKTILKISWQCRLRDFSLIIGDPLNPELQFNTANKPPRPILGQILVLIVLKIQKVLRVK